MRDRRFTVCQPLALLYLGLIAGLTGQLTGGAALGQSATVPMRPKVSPSADFQYPDAIRCEIASPAGIRYSTTFYKSQVVSFNGQPNNVAEYGTPISLEHNPSESDSKYRWRLQLGNPGNITVLTLPVGWFSSNCQTGKSISSLIAEKQALKIFVAE